MHHPADHPEHPRRLPAHRWEDGLFPEYDHHNTSQPAGGTPHRDHALPPSPQIIPRQAGKQPSTPDRYTPADYPPNSSTTGTTPHHRQDPTTREVTRQIPRPTPPPHYAAGAPGTPVPPSATAISRLPGQRMVYVDLCAPLHTLTFDVCKLIVVTGVAWMAIGAVDRQPPLINVPPYTHNLLVVLWLIGVLFTFIIPLIRSRRRRLMVTDDQLILHNYGGVSGRDVIQLREVSQISRRRKTLYLQFGVDGRTVAIEQVAQAKQVAAVLTDRITAVSRWVY
ncbi:hypothetical protein ACFPVT_02510 [Corynebacterium choanae]|uniref:Uncharacterized protein n=1 Tax=Corynebacterium choanae TaxID=1862358 RepID=A0A3G6J8V7_9CORY|nr:hypothetical protein [Corynebacterium choanae]AZA12890.1 hypothetical protein CCHOA_02365 [Corynebacterium choanae]